MIQGKKVFVFLLTVYMMAVSFALPAAAAEVPEESYEVLIPEVLGEVTETLTRDLSGEIKKEEVLLNLVPVNTALSFEAKKKVGAMVLGYSQKEGVLYPDALQWTIFGSEQVIYEFQPLLTGTLTLTKQYSYYELVVWDEDSNESNYFFKISDGMELINQPDAWAKVEVAEAIAAGLIPSELQGKYKEKITRADFSKLIIKLVEVKTGLAIEDLLVKNGLNLDDNPFTDTDLEEIVAANKLGIVNGKGGGKFDPNGSITRQEAAIMLTKTAKGLGYEVAAEPTAYSDNTRIGAWASAGVEFVTAYGVMNGTGNNSFNPQGTYTRQQAYITIARLNNVLE